MHLNVGSHPPKRKEEEEEEEEEGGERIEIWKFRIAR